MSGKSQPIRVLCVDDHRIVREGLALIVNRQPDMTVVGSASSGEESVDLFLKLRPDVTLMDLQLGVMSGVDAIRAIRKQAASDGSLEEIFLKLTEEIPTVQAVEA